MKRAAADMLASTEDAARGAAAATAKPQEPSTSTSNAFLTMSSSPNGTLLVGILFDA